MPPPQPPPGRRPTVLVAALVLSVVLAACGADVDDPPSGTGTTAVDDGPRVADPRFEGDFRVTALTVGGDDVALRTVPFLNIETVFGGLTVRPGCNTYFGSFTLSGDGSASFTVAGGSDQDCGDLDRQEELVLQALGAATSWTAVGDGFRFESGAGDAITIGP